MHHVFTALKVEIGGRPGFPAMLACRVLLGRREDALSSVIPVPGGADDKVRD